MITEKVEDDIFKNFKEYVEEKLHLSDKEAIDIITSPHFTEAMCLFYKEITDSNLYREIYGDVMKKDSFIKDDKYGFCEMAREIDNPLSDNSHDIYFNMRHLYEYSDYYEADEGCFIEDVGEFKEYEPSFDTLSKEAQAIYETIKESNENNDYVKTILQTKNIEELYQHAHYSFHDTFENPFESFSQHASSSGLNYLDTESRRWNSDKQKHKAVSLDTPLGPIAYIHFKSNLKTDGTIVDDNSFHISSIGVIPSLRQKGIAKELYKLADEKLGFNGETIIHRTSPGRLAPKDFTDKVYDITKGHKALYLDNYLTKYNFSAVKGFDDLSRKEQVESLRELNDSFYKIQSKTKEKSFSNPIGYTESEKMIEDFKTSVKEKASLSNKTKSRVAVDRPSI